ncbi:TRAP transporter substrate-binding protein DctP [Acidobacteria bacterium AH-259-L09]|nr:TRAP transporter substrate-binding protein DctP [Acidobacteria bacterium AH-259-L09]
MTKFVFRWMLLLLVVTIPLQAQGRRIVINMGTLAPEGTAWHDVLLQMRQDWNRISRGRVVLRIYPSGVQGDENTMIRKMRIGQLQAVAVSGNGLSRIEPAISCLQIPLMLDSYEELDYVRDQLAPQLEGMIEQKGFKILNWADTGWVRFFTKRPASTLDDIRGMKLLTSAGDPETEELYKDFGFQVVPLPYTEVLTALQTGLIEAVQGPPLYAMVEQWFGLATNMTEVKWAPLVGATVISNRAWERIPANMLPELLEAARTAGRRLLTEIRQLNEDAIPAMTKRGLNVVHPDAAALSSWFSEAKDAYPKLRGRYVSADLFDEVERLRNEFRSQQTGQAEPLSNP